jgi:cell division protein FtsL
MATADDKKPLRDSLPCNQHVTIFLWICGLLVTSITVLTNNVIANDRRALFEEKQLYTQIQGYKDENSLEHARMISEASSLSREVLQRLARIETKIEAIK